MAPMGSDMRIIARRAQDGTLPGGLVPTMASLQARWREYIESIAPSLSRNMVDLANDQTRNTFAEAFAREMSIDAASVFINPAVNETYQLHIQSNAGLITNLVTHQLDEMQTAVLRYMRQEPQRENRTFLQEVDQIVQSGRTRARTIAGDQISKLTSLMNRDRAEASGITHFIWRTSKDLRVVGNPSGLYPDGNHIHGDHYAREGKTYAYDDPPADGLPGYPINCRCYAEPVLPD